MFAEDNVVFGTCVVWNGSRQILPVQYMMYRAYRPKLPLRYNIPSLSLGSLLLPATETATSLKFRTDSNCGCDGVLDIFE